MTGPVVTVGYADTALAVLVADAARRVPGVVRLQRRPASAVASVLGAGVVAAADTSAVELDRTAGGTLEVAVRLVSTLHPTPRQVVDDVGAATRARLAEIGEQDVRIEVTVTDVRS